MKYLFFDVECSNCHGGIGKICEFGYVLTDENLKVIDADDIPMSPGKGRYARFNLVGRKKEKDLILAYDYDYYYDQPEFPHFYERIKKLMCDEETLCFAYSMRNDIMHIYNTCKRYKLEPLNYECYDIQLMAIKYLKENKRINLANACKRIVGPNSLVKIQLHLARDDAKMEMMILDAIACLEQKSCEQLIEETNDINANSIALVKQIEETKKKKMKSEGHNLYRSLVATDEELDDKKNIGKRYNLSGNLKCQLDKLKNALDIIKRQGGVIADTLKQTDIFVFLDEQDKETVQTKFKYPIEFKMITYEELLNLDK